MARLLVATDLTSMGQRALAERLAERARADGHDTTVVQDAPLAACKDADAAVCLIDGSGPGAMPIAVAATAHALGLPTLALHTHALPTSIASLFSMAQAVTREEDLAAGLVPFYAQVRPFAGKLVRDQVPRLVREAGHEVVFREASADERPRYLKRKVADEANELLEADPGQEREEVADLLEALETLLRVRGYDRDDLKLVKEAKRKRRGGFERFLIVESATTSALAQPTPPTTPQWPAEEPRLIRPRSPPAPPEPEPEPETLALPEEPFQLPSIEPESPAPAPAAEEPAFQFPSAFTEPAPEPQARREPLSVPEVALPSWLTTEPIAAAPASVPAQASVPLRTYEAPQPIFQPPAIPSFRIQTPPPAPHNRAKLWNLGKAGEKEEILEEFEDPDRIEPSVRDV